jgi:hypothetical protein
MRIDEIVFVTAVELARNDARQTDLARARQNYRTSVIARGLYVAEIDAACAALDSAIDTATKPRKEPASC